MSEEEVNLLQNELLASCVVIPAEAGIQDSLIFKNWIPDDCLGNDKTVFLQKAQVYELSLYCPSFIISPGYGDLT